MNMQQPRKQTIASIHEANNNGVRHFDQGDLQSAFQCFRESLQLLKASFQNHTEATASSDTEMQCESGIDPLSCSSLAAHAPNMGGIVEGLQSVDQGNPVIASSMPTTPIHSRSFRLLHGMRFSSNDLENDKVISAFLIFNNALVFHLQGTQQGSKASLYLGRALAMYKQVAVLLQDYIEPLQATGNAAVDLLCMAVLNNAGVLLLSECHDLPSSRRVFGQLALFAHSFQHVHGTGYVEPVPRSQAREQASTRTSNVNNKGSGSTPLLLGQEEVANVFDQVSNFLLNATIMSYTDPASAAAA